jgi:hypothetical protein
MPLTGETGAYFAGFGCFDDTDSMSRWTSVNVRT